MAEALNIDSTDRGEQVRSIRRGDGGKDDGIFHGQGGKPEVHKEDFGRYVIELLRALDPVLQQERDPLVLAGVEYELSMFTKVCTYPHLMDSHLIGNADKISEHQLHANAWHHLSSAVDVPLQQSIQRYRRDAGKGTTSRELRELVVGAARGDIDVVFIERGLKRWGRFDPAHDTLDEHPEREPMDDELFDYVATQTWLAKGAVFILPSGELPEATGVAAIYRRGRIPQPANSLVTAAS
jgi:hypothetical protein